MSLSGFSWIQIFSLPKKIKRLLRMRVNANAKKKNKITNDSNLCIHSIYYLINLFDVLFYMFIQHIYYQIKIEI